MDDTKDWIAFYRSRNKDNITDDIWLVNVMTNKEIQITNSSRYYEYAPVWLSESKLLYFIEPQPESYTERNIVLLDFVNGKRKLLDFWTWQDCPGIDRVSVDSSGNIYYTPVGGEEIYVLSLVESKPKPKLIFTSDFVKQHGLSELNSPIISSDGVKLLFVGCDTLKFRLMHIEQKKRYYDVYYYHRQEGTLKRLTIGDYDNGCPSWIGKDSIIYSSKRNDNWDLYLMNKEGVILKRLTNTKDIDEWQGATISPDHKTICYAGYDKKTKELNMWLMDLGNGTTKFLTKGGKPAWSPKNN
jgi:Tol biopolymer transport system component